MRTYLPALLITIAVIVLVRAYQISVAEDIASVYAHLHDPGSGSEIHRRFSDVRLVFTDHASGVDFSEGIPPFQYFYSKKAGKTFGICAIDKSVFICEGMLDRLISAEDIESGTCVVTDTYKEKDVRLDLDA